MWIASLGALPALDHAASRTIQAFLLPSNTPCPLFAFTERHFMWSGV